MRLIVGLGNPGERYRRTRHNIGFMAVDALAAELDAAPWRSEADALVATAEIAGAPLLLVKPQTFMNRSGVAVAELLDAYAPAPPPEEGEPASEDDSRPIYTGLPRDLLVIFDDISLDLGTIRIRERGGHGGHNGLRSIIECLDTEDFPRLRLGIRKGDAQGDLAEYVLASFPEEDVLVVQEIVGYAVEAVKCALEEGTTVAMSRYNGPIKQG
jgi:PTH1 family peptidyl-tRNA hydrolase